MRIHEMQTILSGIREVQMRTPGAAPPPVKFAYMLAKNARLLTAELQDVEAAVNEGVDLDAVAAYDKERVALLSAKAIQGFDGLPLLKNNEFQFGEDRAQILIDVEAALSEKFPDMVLILRTRRQREIELLEKDVDIRLVTLPIEGWPDIPASILDQLFDLIDHGAGQAPL